jgi:VWFA-related protein
MLVGSWIGEIIMVVRLQALGLLLLLILSPVSIAAQQTNPATPNPATNQQPPVIHSTTRLVQLSVIAQDGKGEPITGLKKEDFSLFDEGKPQAISFFSCGTPAPSTPPPALPSNYFTNRFDLKGEDPGAVTVILFDALNTAPQEQSYVRKQILRFLLTLKPQDHVAMYALTNNLIVLHDFTQDSSALVTALSRFSPRELAAYDASTSQAIDFYSISGNDPQWLAFQNSLNNAEGEIADQATLNRIGTTTAALEIIANHVSIIPGRKSLVWVSGGFPIQIGIGNIGVADREVTSANSSSGSGGGTGPADPVSGSDPTNQLPRRDRETGPLTSSIKTATDALNRANMSIYPVDARGVEISTGTIGMSAGTRSTSATPSLSSGGFFGRQDIHDSANLLADRTGGKAFYGNNDIRDAVRRAFDDGRYACNIGYYPDHGQWDGKFRELKVKVNSQGAHLRYRKGYYAFPDRSEGEEVVKAALQQAAVSPLETTNIGLIVNGKTIAPLSARSLQLQIGVDPKQLLLTPSDNRQKGGLDMVFVQSDASGHLLVADKQHFDINFEQKQYEFLAKAGMILQRTVEVQPNSEEIRVVVRDAGSGAVGSVNIPVKTFFPANEKTSRPPASN